MNSQPRSRFAAVGRTAYERFIYLSDVRPNTWQAVEYAGIPQGGSVVVLGLVPIGDMACRIARHRGGQSGHRRQSGP